MQDSDRFFDLSLDLLCTMCREGSFLRVNSAFQATLGWSQEQLEGQLFVSIIHPEDREATVRELVRLVDGGSRAAFETRSHCPNGDSRRIQWTAICNDGHILAVGRDLTAYHGNQQEAFDERHRFQALVEHSADLIALLGPDGRLKYVSPAFERVLGHSKAEILEGPAIELVWPEDVALAQSLEEQSLASPGLIVPFLMRARRSGGGFLWLEGTVVNYLDDPSTRGIVINLRDVTERTLLEEKRRESSELLARLSQQIPGVIYQFQLFPDGRACLPFASEAIYDMFEVTPEEVRHDASLIFTRIHPDDHDDVMTSIQDSAGTLEHWLCEFRVVLPTRGMGWRSGRARPQRQDDGSTLWHGFLTDITERKEAQQALEESEQRYRVQIEVATEAIVVIDAETRKFVDVNENALNLFGLSRLNFTSFGPLDLSPPFQPDGRASAAAINCDAARAMAGEIPIFEWTHRNVAGQDIPCEVRLVRLPSGCRQLVRGSITDITRRKRAEEDLRKKEAAIASSVYGIAMADMAGKLTYVNRAFLQMWGYDDESQVLGRPTVSFWGSPEAAAHTIREVQQHGAWSGELEAQGSDGNTINVQVNASLFNDARGNSAGMLASFLDITQSKRLQQQFLQAQKMESVGRLAGGVAHDFNNLLTVMKGYLELALSDLSDQDPVREDLLEVEKAATSATALTQQLLAFSRKQIIHPQVLNLNEVVLKVKAMLQRVLGEDIQLETLTAADLGRVRFDPGQVEQILLNLAVNARDAMPQGGKLTLETANLEDHVALVVTDNGSGMSEDVKAHLFEPFFTTKGPGSGTGLGLATIYGAVTQNGGKIEVISQSGMGTTFKILLPRLAEPQVESDVLPPGALPRGCETIVLVEDEESVRSLARRLLERQGYRVLCYGNGPDALEAMGAMTESLDLLITDVIMPGMNGRVLSDKVLALRPNMAVLFTSGYTADVILPHGVSNDGPDFLGKPYSGRALAQKVREALDKTRP